MDEPGSGGCAVGLRYGASVAATLALTLGLALPVASLQGCAATAFARGAEGTDIRAVKVGATRSQIEALLGTAIRQWTTTAAVEYRVYRYDAGKPGSAGDAAAFAIMDIGTLGLWEVFAHVSPPRDLKPGDPSRMRNLAVAYDQDGIAVGVFPDVGDLEQLPDDGKRVKPASEH